jgi:hypothetical protein
MRYLFLLALSIHASQAVTVEEVRLQTLAPYTGPSHPGIDRTSMMKKVVCGYQGWFCCEGDGAERGWIHWTKGRGALGAENCKVDLWPDMTELGPEERFATQLRLPDGSPAQVFSSAKRETVLRHFRWMQEYGIDAAMVQRFANGLQDPRVLRHNNHVLSHCREGAHLSGRGYTVMYDLSGLKAGKMNEVISDWRSLVQGMALAKDSAVMHHEGKPLVAIWGIGFSDDRAYTLAECRLLVDAIKADGFSIMLGVPTYWREMKRDAVSDPALHELLQKADILSPWTVGRYNSPESASRHAEKVASADQQWCREKGLDYLPVIFPGFSWHNMHGGELNSIPRLKGDFFWSQIQANQSAQMLYVAMFDEVDEATAIFKCSNHPPMDQGPRFIDYEGLPSDYYLRLTGAAGQMLRGELPPTAPKPSP